MDSSCASSKATDGLGAGVGPTARTTSTSRSRRTETCNRAVSLLYVLGRTLAQNIYAGTFPVPDILKKRGGTEVTPNNASLSVLVINEDAEILSFFARILDGNGIRALLARDAGEAVGIAKRGYVPI